MANWADSPKRIIPIHPGIHLEAPGANVRLLGIGCALPRSKAVVSLWPAWNEDVRGMQRGRLVGLFLAFLGRVGR